MRASLGSFYSVSGRISVFSTRFDVCDHRIIDGPRFMCSEKKYSKKNCKNPITLSCGLGINESKVSQVNINSVILHVTVFFFYLLFTQQVTFFFKLTCCFYVNFE